MRISDWSSDVCSSDLHGIAVLFHSPAGLEIKDRSGKFPLAELPRSDQRSAGKIISSGSAREHDKRPVPVQRITLRLLVHVEFRIASRQLFRSEERRVGKERGSTCRPRW